MALLLALGALLAAVLRAEAEAPASDWAVLSVGAADGLPIEQWVVPRKRVPALPRFDPLRDSAPLDVAAAVRQAQADLRQRFAGRRFEFSELRLVGFIPADAVREDTRYRDWVYLVEFVDEPGTGREIVPVLLDGSVVRGQHED